MRKNLIKKNVLSLAVISLFVLLNISYLTTNNASRIFIEPSRYLLVMFVLLSIGILTGISNPSKKTIAAIIIFSLICLYGFFLAYLNNSFNIGITGFFTNFIIIISGLFIVTKIDQEVISSSNAIYLLIITILGFLVTVMINGFEFFPFPHFNFEYSSENKGTDTMYSQGISKFFGYGAIVAAYIATNRYNLFSKISGFILTLFLISLSLIGGARGDSIMAVIVVAIFLGGKYFLRFFLALVLISIFFYLAIDDWKIVEKIIIFRRLSSLDGEYGDRDVLLLEVYELLANEPLCLIIGCGFGFFQSYHGFEYGRYPHNFIAEAAIIFGLPLLALFGVLAARGIYCYLKKVGKLDLFLLLFLYSFFIGLKSGTVLAHWFLCIALIYFASLTLNDFKLNIKYKT